MAHPYRGQTGRLVVGGILDGSPVLAALAALDTMTDVSGTNLEAHVPDSGLTSWAESTAGGITIQSNKAQAAIGVLGGADGVLASPGIANDKFTLYADIKPAGTGALAGLRFRSAGTLATGTDTFLQCNLAANPETSVTLYVRRWAAGSAAETFTVASGLNLGSIFTTGLRLGVDVLGNVVTVWTAPYGGGAKTVQGAATLVTGLNDSGHKCVGLWRTSNGEIGTTWDNVTMISGAASGASAIAVGVLTGTLRGVVFPGDTFTIPSETGTPLHTVGGSAALLASGNAIAGVPISPNLASDVAPGSPISFVSNAAAQTKSWAMTPKIEMLDASAQGDSWKSFLPGLASWVGKLQVMLDLNDPIHLALHTKLSAAVPTTTPFGIVLRVPPDGVNPGYQWYGFCNCSNWRTSTPVNQLVLADCDFQGTGALLAN